MFTTNFFGLLIVFVETMVLNAHRELSRLHICIVDQKTTTLLQAMPHEAFFCLFCVRANEEVFAVL